MSSFEEFGKRVDEEVQKLRHFFETQFKPTTGRKTAAALREAARRLSQAADEIEARLAKEQK